MLIKHSLVSGLLEVRLLRYLSPTPFHMTSSFSQIKKGQVGRVVGQEVLIGLISVP